MEDEELKRYYSLYTDVWKFFRKYSDPDGSNEFLENMVTEAKEIYEKYQAVHLGKLASKLLTATMRQIKGIYNKKLNNGGKNNG